MGTGRRKKPGTFPPLPNQIFERGEEVKIEIKSKIPPIVIPKIKINLKTIFYYDYSTTVNENGPK
jgi:hypothetical protein